MRPVCLYRVWLRYYFDDGSKIVCAFSKCCTDDDEISDGLVKFPFGG